MSTKILITGLATLVLALGAFIFLLSTGPEIEAPKPPPAPSKKTSSPATGGGIANENPPAASAPIETTAAPQEQPAELNPESRQAIMDKMQEAVATYSDEGVAVVEPLLQSPDIAIREMAVEAMKQIATPGAAESLRRAAQKPTTSPLEKRILLEAAAFIDLPEHQFTPIPRQGNTP